MQNFARVLSFQNVKETALGGSRGRVTAKTASGAGSSLAVLALLSQTYVTPPFSQRKLPGRDTPLAALFACHKQSGLRAASHKQSGLIARVSVSLLGETRPLTVLIIARPKLVSTQTGRSAAGHKQSGLNARVSVSLLGARTTLWRLMMHDPNWSQCPCVVASILRSPCMLLNPNE